MIPTKFTREVTVMRRDEQGALVEGPDKKPIPGRVLGAFTFRRPTVYDTMEIGVRRAQNLRGQPVNVVDMNTAMLAEMFSVIPWQIEKVPDGWDWAKQYEFWDLYAIYETYQQGLAELAKPSVDGAKTS